MFVYTINFFHIKEKVKVSTREIFPLMKYEVESHNTTFKDGKDYHFKYPEQ